MNFNEYQEKALETAIYPTTYVESSTPANYIYPALGLVGEAGEVVEKVKKLIRDKGGEFNKDDVEAIKKELGDVLWYVSVLASEFSISLDEIAEANIKKLASRKKRGKLKGSGDNR